MPRTLRVLLVEDNPDDVLLIARQLRKEGFELNDTTVSTLDEVRSALETNTFHVILSDYNLGAFTGLDVLKLARESQPDVPFIFVSGKIGEDVAVELIRGGAQDYVLKSQLPRLGAVIQRELEEKRRHEEAIRADQALRESESRYRLLFENLHDPVFIVDKQARRIIDCNVESVNRFGYSRDELIGMDPADLHADDDKERFVDYFAVPADRTTDRWVLKTKSGTRIPVETRVTELDVLGRTVRMAIVRDLSESERQRIEIQRRQEYLHALLENISDAIVIVDSRARLLYQSPVTEKLLGYVEEEYLGRNVFMMVHREDLSRVRDLFTGLSQEVGKRVSANFRLRHRAGYWVYIEANSVNLLDNEIVNGVLISLRDVTDRMQAEERFRLAFQTSPDAIAITKEGGGYVDVNEGFVALYGMPKERIVGNTTSGLDIWVDEDEKLEFLDLLNSEGEVRNVEISFRNAQRKIFKGLISARWILLNGERHVISMTRDITKLKKAEEDRAQLQRQLMQSQKLETVGRLASGVAHDFNNLLTAITMSTELAEANAEDKPSLLNDLAQIREVSLRAASLTRQLLTFSRNQVVVPTLVNLAHIMHEMEMMLRRLIGEDIDLVVDPKSEMLPLKIDPAQIEQVIVNLAVNARDAMPRGGRLTIEAESKKVVNKVCRACKQSFSGTYIKLAVRDTGIGIPPEVLEHIFDPFFTTKEEGKGTGLGLSTVLGIVNQSDGHFEVSTARDEGTVFTIYLPISAKAAVEPESSNGEEDDEPKQGRVLVVDDEESVLTTISRALEKVGFRVWSADSGESALEIARAEKAGFDFIVTDIIMPNMSGDQLVEEILKIHPTIQPVFMSGYAPEIIRERAEHIEGARFLQKPFGPKRLIEELRKGSNSE